MKIALLSDLQGADSVEIVNQALQAFQPQAYSDFVDHDPEFQVAMKKHLLMVIHS